MELQSICTQTEGKRGLGMAAKLCKALAGEARRGGEGFNQIGACTGDMAQGGEEVRGDGYVAV